jgi:hypothetical protein
MFSSKRMLPIVMLLSLLLMPHSQNAEMPMQGIQGHVFQLSGNHMPTFATAPMPSAQVQPYETRVWIFQGSVASKGAERWPLAYAKYHPNLLTKVATDAQGEFMVELDPGEYTLFLETGEDLYLNEFMGNGDYATTEVVANQTKTVNLRLMAEAFF